MDPTIPALVEGIRRIHARMRRRVIDACLTRAPGDLSAGVAAGAGDFIYEIDRVSELGLVDDVERELAADAPVVLIGEGIGDGQVVVPRGAAEADARWRIIIDPIDGTRGLMFQKRPAWILTGVAPNRGDATQLDDIVLAVQTELPLVKQHLADQAWGIKGQGVTAERWNRLTGESTPLVLTPSKAADIRHGFATVCRFFPGASDVLGRINDELCRRLLGPRQPSEALVFEDQYSSTGGQIYGLASGQDRFVADLRPLMEPILAARGEPLGHCCHPYDLCTKLIAEEAGVAIASPTGGSVAAPLDVHTKVAWVGYANDALRRQVEPVLRALLADLHA